jgi:hypothetical protein
MLEMSIETESDRVTEDVLLDARCNVPINEQMYYILFVTLKEKLSSSMTAVTCFSVAFSEVFPLIKHRS